VWIHLLAHAVVVGREVRWVYLAKERTRYTRQPPSRVPFLSRVAQSWNCSCSEPEAL
jgi:hypothetical protein